MKNDFDLKYFFLGEGKKDWYKAWGTGWRLFFTFLIIGLIGLTIYKAYFAPTQKQNQSNVVNAQPGSTVNIGQSQTNVKKRAWWLPHLFTEIYAFAESDSRTGVGSKLGLHWEF